MYNVHSNGATPTSSSLACVQLLHLNLFFRPKVRSSEQRSHALDSKLLGCNLETFLDLDPDYSEHLTNCLLSQGIPPTIGSTTGTNGMATAAPLSKVTQQSYYLLYRSWITRWQSCQWFLLVTWNDCKGKWN